MGVIMAFLLYMWPLWHFVHAQLKVTSWHFSYTQLHVAIMAFRLYTAKGGSYTQLHVAIMAFRSCTAKSGLMAFLLYTAALGHYGISFMHS